MTAVYLVGAGPGDPSLITVRGLRCLERADVVVYDHLVHPRLLSMAPSHAERIDVGAAAPQPGEQDAICLLVSEKAREGKIVVRLKWGDPFFFDSGGKEAIFLHEQGIAFEVVPGLPAGIAVPSYAGVPVTYPGAGESVTFVKGFEDGSQAPARIDWMALAHLGGTVVCYAGARQVPAVLQSMLDGGCAETEPAAIVQDGSLPSQRTITGTLGELTRRIAGETRRGSSIVIIGKVAALREHLRWFDARPLFGKRIVVTRAREQAMELVDRLEELGAQAIEGAAVRIAAVADTAALDEAVRDGVELRLAGVHEPERRRPLHAARHGRARRRALPEGPAHLRRRTGDRRQAGALRPEGRRGAARASGRARRRGDARARRAQGRQGALPAIRDRARGAGRRPAQGRRAGHRPRRLPHARRRAAA